MDKESFIVYIKPEDIFPDIAKRCWNNISNYKLDGKIMTKFDP